MQAANSVIFLVLLMAIFYFMLIRPQKRRVQQHQQLLESIGVGDEVVTIGGLHGTVRAIGNDDIEIEAAPGVTLTFVKNAVARRVVEELDEGTSEDASEEETPPILAAGDEDKSS